ncbi:MAG TPA: hypothetical protein VKT82_01640 [Ktedonobacterales bacterium]|nr:hypothetical protein [Ktedonobacterales bacterium]
MEPPQPEDPYYPEFNRPDYLQPPPSPPPPPAPQKRQVNIIVALIVLCIVLILALPVTAYFVFYRSEGSSLTTPSVPLATEPASTPTLNARAGLLTDDFSKFLESFSALLEQHDYVSIQTAADTENFQAIPLRASGSQDWQQFYGNLTYNAYSLSISSPPLTPDQAGYACFGYGPSGIAYLDLTINAKLMYVVGTAQVPGTPPDANPFYAINGTVFVFELPYGPSATWLWRAVTFNNSLGCG